jgi:hypothetical protein
VNVTDIQTPTPAKALELADPKEGLTQQKLTPNPNRLVVSGLQYHINIVLPDTRDQAIYDAIFKSLREHLG